MANVRSRKRSSHAHMTPARGNRPSILKAARRGRNCQRHAEDGMVNDRTKRCSHDPCTRQLAFNIEGSKKGANCRQHAEDGMVNVRKKHCAHDTCTRQPTFDFEGSKPGAYCRQHAEDGMVNVRKKRCSHNSCARRPVWGLLTDCAATVCSHHKRDIMGAPVINFRARCKAEVCGKECRWGLHGKQPSHCHDHGLLEDGLVCTVARADRNNTYFSPSYQAVRGPSFHVKAECMF